jgi:toxin YoeB
MPLLFTDTAWQDYVYWAEQNPKVLAQINRLIEDIRRNPYQGLGKPEPLKHQLSGFWSRRINLEHRLVYRVADKRIEIIQCRYHYR